MTDTTSKDYVPAAFVDFSCEDGTTFCKHGVHSDDECPWCKEDAERDATILSLRLKLEELEKGKWQDISTAPKDSRGLDSIAEERDVLTWDGECMRVASHFHGDFWITPGQAGHAPTHWQPLPSPPQIMEEGK
jgi:hypothetical protein